MFSHVRIRKRTLGTHLVDQTTNKKNPRDFVHNHKTRPARPGNTDTGRPNVKKEILTNSVPPQIHQPGGGGEELTDRQTARQERPGSLNTSGLGGGGGELSVYSKWEIYLHESDGPESWHFLNFHRAVPPVRRRERSPKGWLPQCPPPPPSPPKYICTYAYARRQPRGLNFLRGGGWNICWNICLSSHDSLTWLHT